MGAKPQPLFLDAIWALGKVCSLSECCFIISIEVSGGHSQLRCKGFAGSHQRESN